MAIICHITAHDEWEKARGAGEYRAPSLESESFIHCSEPNQVLGVANNFYRGLVDLVLLCIDPARLTADLKYEPPADSHTDGLFPHIYGPLNLDAVIGLLAFTPQADGTFQLPPEVDLLA